MEDNTSNQKENCVEIFMEAMSQIPNVFEGIAKQDELPMTRQERKILESELHNYWDYKYVLSGVYMEGFNLGLGTEIQSLSKEFSKKGNAIYDSLQPMATHPMTQEERDQFADKWLERRTFYATQKGAFLHGLEEGKKMKHAIELSARMKALGVSAEIIMQVTGLTIEEIEKL